MGPVKHTKHEWKAQRDALRRYERYLPTLQLKKKQLQAELRHIEAHLEEKEQAEQRQRAALASWIRLFAEPVDLAAYLRLERAVTTTTNIAGVNIPVLQEVPFTRRLPDLFETRPWVDEGLQVMESLLRLRVERDVLAEQHRLLGHELRATSQRVNLFEKIKIPECLDNIRVIRIFLGDQQTAGVVRAKMAKSKALEKVRAA